jgi:hypothetical protein
LGASCRRLKKEREKKKGNKWGRKKKSEGKEKEGGKKKRNPGTIRSITMRQWNKQLKHDGER